MSIRFLSNNLLDGSVKTASTTNAQYPLSNLSNSLRTKTYRSTSNSDNLVIDLGTAESVDSFMLVDNWKNGFGIMTLTLEANATDEWSAPAFSTSVTLDTKFGIAHSEFTAESYRFWRLVMTSSLGYCELSNFFLGTASTITTNGVGYNWSYVNKDLSRATTNRNGQEYIDLITSRKELNNLQFQIMDKDEIDVLLGVFDTNSITKPFYVYFPLELDSLINEDNRYNGMYRFKQEPEFINTNSGYYNTTLSLRENK